MTLDLDDLPTEDLLKALLVRFDNACFVGAKDGYKGPGRPEITVSFTGEPDPVGALCMDAAITVSPEVRRLLE